MNGRILGFQRLARCPKWTPDSMSSCTCTIATQDPRAPGAAKALGGIAKGRRDGPARSRIRRAACKEPRFTGAAETASNGKIAVSVAVYMDVHIDRAITDALRGRGVDVVMAQEDGSDTLDDPALLDRALALSR